MDTLLPKQKLYVENIISKKYATKAEAARAAGYNATSANNIAYAIEKSPAVQKALAQVEDSTSKVLAKAMVELEKRLMKMNDKDFIAATRLLSDRQIKLNESVQKRLNNAQKAENPLKKALFVDAKVSE